MRTQLLTLLLLAVFPAASAAAQMPPIEDLLGQFERIAFASEFGGQARKGRLIKWTGPIRARITGPGAARFRAEVEQQFVELRRLSGLDIRFLPDRSVAGAANMEIVFVNDGARRAANGRAPCVTHLDVQGFALRSARIYIVAGDTKLRRHCIVEEITQALGLANDSSLFRHSIFSDDSHQQSLAPWDKLMILTLYDPRLRPGMPKPRAMALARFIMFQLLERRAGRW